MRHHAALLLRRRAHHRVERPGLSGRSAPGRSRGARHRSTRPCRARSSPGPTSRSREDGVPHDVADRAVRAAGRADDAALGAHRRATRRRARDITPPASPTWIYIATEAAPTEARRVEEAVRAFLIAGLRPGFKVSLGGRPFTDDKTALLATLSRLSRNPMGSNGQPGLVDLARPLADDAAEERALAPPSGARRKASRRWPGFTRRVRNAWRSAAASRSR